MKKLSFKQIEIIGVGFGIIFGTMLHFLFEWTGRATIIGLFSAVNESAWEHLKMFYVPVLIFLAVEWFFVKDKKTLLLSKVVEAVFGIYFILTVFYTYSGIFGHEILIVDILSFYLTVIIGKYISYKVNTAKVKWQGYTALHVAVLSLIMILFWVATFIPPHIPLFRDLMTNTYGLSQTK